jgi:hypothetical protein
MDQRSSRITVAVEGQMLANSRDPRMSSGAAACATDSKPKVA